MKSHLVVLFGSLFLLSSMLPAGAQAASSALTAAKDEGKLNVHGFVDGGWYNDSGVPTNQGFLVRDGAIFVDKSLAGGSVTIALPLRSAVNNSLGSGAVRREFGFDLEARGQAYIAYKYDNGAFWKLGKFDKLFGVESNFTDSVRFTTQGLLYTFFAPRTHTGMLAGYRLAEMFDIQLYAAHTNGVLSADGFGSASGVGTTFGASSNRYDFGGQVGARTDDLQLLFGYRMKKDAQANATESLLDVIGGFKLGPIHYNAGFDLGNYAEAARKSSVGLLGLVAYDISSALAAGVRFEYITNMGGIDGGKGLLLTVGPQYRMNENITFKADYSFKSQTFAAGADATKSHILAADVVYAL